MNIKKGDTVKMLNGDDKGVIAKVIRAFPRDNKVLIEGVNVIKRHERPRRQGQKGAIVERPMPVHVSNVARTDGAKAAKAVVAKSAPAKVVKAKAVKK